MIDIIYITKSVFFNLWSWARLESKKAYQGAGVGDNCQEQGWQQKTSLLRVRNNASQCQITCIQFIFSLS